MQFSIRLRQRVVPLIAAFLLGMQLMDPSRVWMFLGVTIGATCLLAYLWVRSLGRNLQLRRDRHLGWVQAGGHIEERFTVSNHSFFPALWVELKDYSTLPAYDVSTTLSLNAGEFKQWDTAAYCGQRGVYFLGGAVLVTGDPFGIYEVTVQDSARTSLIVLPQIAKIPKLKISPAGFYGEGKPRPNSLHQTISAAGVREYQPEDSLRLIHWPTTARIGQPFVKLVENAPEGNWWILLDLDERPMLGEGWDSVEEQSVSLAASLADVGLLARKAVGLISNSSQLTWLVPKRDENQRWEILHALAQAKPGTATLSTLLQRLNPVLGRNHSLIVITASLDLEWTKNILSLKSRGVVPTVMLLDPLTFGGTGLAEATAAKLREQGVICHVIPRGMIKPPERQPEKKREWTWRHTPDGQVIPIQSVQRISKRGMAR